MTTRPGHHIDPPRVTCAHAGCDTELLASRASARAWSEASSPWLCGLHDLTRRCPDCHAPVAVANNVVRFAHLSWCKFASPIHRAASLSVDR